MPGRAVRRGLGKGDEHGQYRRGRRRRRQPEGDQRPARAAALLFLAYPHAADLRDRLVFRRLQFARHRHRAAGADRDVEAGARPDRRADLDRLRRPAHRVHRRRLGGRAVGPHPDGDGDAADLHAGLARLRIRRDLRPAFLDPLRAGAGPRRRGADHGRLHQRVRQGRTARALLARPAGAVRHRPVHLRPGRHLGGAASRLAVDVRHRGGAGTYRVPDALGAAGIAALAGEQGPRRRRDAVDRAHRAGGDVRRQDPAAAACRNCRR